MNIDMIVGVVTIVSSILGVGWKLGQIATSIQLDVAELKGLLGRHDERIANIERRLEALESK